MTAAAILARVGALLYGDQWVGPMSRALDINPRTLQRIKAAALSGEDCDMAEGVLSAVYDLVDAAGDILKDA